MNANDQKLDDLLALTRRLGQILAIRSAALKSANPLASPAEHEDMLHLANLYRTEIQRVRADPKTLAAASPGLRQALKTETRQFEGALQRYLDALEAIRTVTEGLVRAIGEEVARERSAPAAYGPRGKTTTGGAPARAAAHAGIAVNAKA